MQRAVEPAVTAAVEAVADGLSGGGGDRGAAGEACERGLACDPAWVRPGDEYLCGRERTDAGLLEQLRRQLPRERLDLACELAFLNGQCLDASGESAEREQRPAQLRVMTALRTDRREPRRSCARVTERSSARSGSGADTSKPRNWQSPARLAITAPSRAALSARNASRSPPARGRAGRAWPSTLRAARIASSASLLPDCRSRRSRPTSSTRSSRLMRNRARPAPNEPVPSTANARLPGACWRVRNPRHLRPRSPRIPHRRFARRRRERVRVAVRVNADHVVQLVCKHPH